MDTKKCFKCQETKTVSEFYKHKKMKDGYLGKCKKCTNKDVKKNRENNAEKIKEYDKSRNQLPHRIAARKKYIATDAGKRAKRRATLKYQSKNPVQRAANVILGNAIRDGRIKKQPCESCNSTKRIHGHHDDYSKPLDVKWFCPQCHKNYHKAQDQAPDLFGAPGLDLVTWGGF